MKYLLLASVLLLSAFAVSGQIAPGDSWPFPGESRRDDDSRIVKEMLAKQKTEREKKEYEELLERGRTALRLSEELERSLTKKTVLSSKDKERLAEFEKVLGKIRKDLGGNDDGETNITDEKSAPPKDVREGVLYLKRSTEELLGQLKRSTRFSVSVAAIESSNTLIRLARFLRLKS